MKKFIGTHIEGDLHTQFKVACAKAGTSISAQLAKLIAAWAKRSK